MGERKAILHIGTHKTGTTFLQSHFSARAAGLRAEGVLWVSDAYDLPGAIIEAERSGRRDALLAHVRRGLDAAFAQAGTLLLSSEGFSGFAGNGYRDTPALAAFCGGMLAGIQVTVVVYLRRQDRFYESYYTQMIQQGESYDLATFRERVPHASLRWLPIIEAYEDALPGCRLVVRPYDRRAFRGQDILADFIDHTGLKGLTGGGAPVAKRNDSYSIAALKLARLLNAAYPDRDSRNLIRGALQGSNATRPFESKNLLDRRERRELLACHAAENAVIRDRFWGGRDWFADDGSEQAEAVDLTRLEDAEVTRLFMNLVRHLTGPGA